MLRPLFRLPLPPNGLLLTPPLRAPRTLRIQRQALIQPQAYRHASSVQHEVEQMSESSLALADSFSPFRVPMEFLHDTMGLPWLWVIPLSAATIRLILYYPITRGTRMALQRRLELSPLLNAQKPKFLAKAKERAKEHPEKGTFKHYKELNSEFSKTITSRFACGRFKTLFMPILQLPVFLEMSWTIREMLGIPGGTLKPFVLRMLGKEPVVGEEAAKQAALAFEPTMMEEGLPWAVDLTAADPTGYLSYGVAAIMASQTLLGMRGQPGGMPVLTRLLLLFSLLIGPLMANAPTGILYYWACSSGMALVTNVYLDWKYPLVRFPACKRPLLNNVLRSKA